MTQTRSILAFGGLSLAVFALTALIFAPLLLAVLWYIGQVSFKTTVIVLLLITIYAGGGGDG